MGVNATWELLNVLTPAVPFFGRVVKHIENSFGLIHSSRHTLPDETEDIRGLARVYRRSHIYHYKSERASFHAKDILSRGSQDFQNSSYLRDYFAERMNYFSFARSTEDYSWADSSGDNTEGRQGYSDEEFEIITLRDDSMCNADVLQI